MGERLVNIFAAFTSAFLIVLYAVYQMSGKPFDVNFAFAPLVIIGITYTMLATHQFIVARTDNLHPFIHPVPFRWVLAIKYASFAVLVWWVLADFFFDMPLEPPLRRGIWLAAALVHVWFLRRFVMWDRPAEEKGARDIRQEQTDIRQGEVTVYQNDMWRQQDERDAGLDQRERNLRD